MAVIAFFDEDPKIFICTFLVHSGNIISIFLTKCSGFSQAVFLYPYPRVLDIRWHCFMTLRTRRAGKHRGANYHWLTYLETDNIKRVLLNSYRFHWYALIAIIVLLIIMRRRSRGGGGGGGGRRRGGEEEEEREEDEEEEEDHDGGILGHSWHGSRQGNTVEPTIIGWPIQKYWK